METKALKKQLGAAIAMVIVAAVALGSATYAWFVSNNTVKATTANISAQSNSAYLVIDYADGTVTKTTANSTSSDTATTPTDGLKLYPATIVKGENANALWQSAYASKASETAENTATRFTIGNGTASDAVTNNYAYKQTFYIGTGGYDGIFSNLKIDGIEVKTKATDGENGNKNLGNAMRVLVVCGTNWQVWKPSETTGALELSSSTDTTTTPAIATEVKKDSDVTVDVYVYYDGSDGNVYSDNLSNISGDNVNNVTVTFSATPTEYGKNNTGN